MIDLTGEKVTQNISLKVDTPNIKINTMKVKALTTQFGDAGFVKEGDVFETSEHHAKALIKLGHAKEADEKAEAVPFKHLDQLHEKEQVTNKKEKETKSDNPGADKKIK